MTSRRLLTLALLMPLLLAPSAAHGATGPVARTDRVDLPAGESTTVRVLANDSRTRRAVLTLDSISPGLTATVTRRRAVRVAADADAVGTVVVRYTLTRNGRSDSARIVVTVEPAAPTGTTLHGLVQSLPVAVEHRDGYDRDLFKHWNAGANPSDGCDTRREVLIAEAVEAPRVGSGCSFTGGSWFSFYDGATTTDSSAFDLDHVVALAEAWDSGAWDWDAARRAAYANDLGDPRSLVAVSASSNRSKSDRDPAEWLPAREQCRFVTEWTVVKHRWSLTVDTAEKAALWDVASGCENVEVTFTVAP